MALSRLPHSTGGLGGDVPVPGKVLGTLGYCQDRHIILGFDDDPLPSTGHLSSL